MSTSDLELWFLCLSHLFVTVAMLYKTSGARAVIEVWGDKLNSSHRMTSSNHVNSVEARRQLGAKQVALGAAGYACSCLPRLNGVHII